MTSGPTKLFVKAVMVHAHASNVEASLTFYEKLRFEVFADDVDGSGTRCVRMTHADARGLLLNIKDAPPLPPAASNHSHLPLELRPVLISLVVDDYLDWISHLQRENIELVNKASHPWGIWLYVKDPSGNLICITTSDMY